VSLSALSVGRTWRLAQRNLAQDRLRLGLSVLGVGLAVMLILFLLGLRAGVFKGARAYLENSPGSVVVMPAGVKSTMTVSGKFIPPGVADGVGQVDGVARVTTVLRTSAIPDLHGNKEYIILVGYDPDLGGGPWKLAAGREPIADNDVVLDRTLASRHGFRIGDTFAISGRELKVVGLSSGTNSWVGTYVFARKTAVESLALAPNAANMLLVTPASGVAPGELVARLRSLRGVNASTKSDVIANDEAVLAGVFNQVLTLMVVVAFIVGALVVGMVIYTATIERQREYGVLKAVGARNGVLYGIVLFQTVIAAGIGVVLGVAFAFAMGRLVMELRPQFLVSIELSAIEATIGAGFIMALLGSLVPARSIAGLAPADVFRR
jgi:putative ABC transport system permease protein